MANIKVVSESPLFDGMAVTFDAPCECSAVDGLTVTYGGESQSFTFRDAHGNDLTGIGNLFSKGAFVRVILNTKDGTAYIQNADTNAYLEAQFASKAPAGYGLGNDFARTITSLEELDTIFENGWYALDTDAGLGGPGRLFGIAFKQASVFVTSCYASLNRKYVWQELQIEGLGYVFKRRYSNRAWSEWEIENPPLRAGIEYRTTETSELGPIYCQVISISSLAANSTQVDLLSHGIRSDALIRYNGEVVSSNPSIRYWLPGNEVSLTYRSGAFYLESHGVGITGYRATLRIYYVKY